MNEKRGSILRRDLNDLVRDASGHLSPSKVGTLLGQWLAVKIILQHGDKLITNYESLITCFVVLIAPELFKKFFNLKYGGGQSNGVEQKPQPPQGAAP